MSQHYLIYHSDLDTYLDVPDLDCYTFFSSLKLVSRKVYDGDVFEYYQVIK